MSTRPDAPRPDAMRPDGLRPVSIGIKTSPQNVDWATLDGAWAAIGRSGAFDAVWMSDHLTNMDPDDPGPSFEALTTAAALAHHVRGMWIGHAVLSNTFRYPAVLAKAATVMDHATGGRFILGIGAGWYEGEHEPFGLDLPPMGERIDRLVSAVEVLVAMGSADAAHLPGVTRDDPHYPLAGATNMPPPRTPGGPPIWLGGQGPRGIALAARYAAGWVLPGGNAGDVDYFIEKRDALARALEDVGRDPRTFDLGAQVTAGTTAKDHRDAVEVSLRFIDAGASHLLIGMPSSQGGPGVEVVAREIAEPLRRRLG